MSQGTLQCLIIVAGVTLVTITLLICSTVEGIKKGNYRALVERQHQQQRTINGRWSVGDTKGDQDDR